MLKAVVDVETMVKIPVKMTVARIRVLAMMMEVRAAAVVVASLSLITTRLQIDPHLSRLGISL